MFTDVHVSKLLRLCLNLPSLWPSIGRFANIVCQEAGQSKVSYLWLLPAKRSSRLDARLVGRPKGEWCSSIGGTDPPLAATYACWVAKAAWSNSSRSSSVITMPLGLFTAKRKGNKKHLPLGKMALHVFEALPWLTSSLSDRLLQILYWILVLVSAGSHVGCVHCYRGLYLTLRVTYFVMEYLKKRDRFERVSKSAWTFPNLYIKWP